MTPSLFLDSTSFANRIRRFAQQNSDHVHLIEHENPDDPNRPLIELHISRNKAFDRGKPLRNVVILNRVDPDEPLGDISTWAAVQQFTAMIEMFPNTSLSVLVNADPVASDKNTAIIEGNINVRELLSTGFRYYGGTRKFGYNFPGGANGIIKPLSDCPPGVQLASKMMTRCHRQGGLVAVIKLDNAFAAPGNFCFASKVPGKVAVDFRRRCARLGLPLAGVTFDWPWTQELAPGMFLLPSIEERAARAPDTEFADANVRDFLNYLGSPAWTASTEPAMFSSTLDPKELMNAFDLRDLRRSEVVRVRNEILDDLRQRCGTDLTLSEEAEGHPDDELTDHELSNVLCETVLYAIRGDIYRSVDEPNRHETRAELVDAATDFSEKAGYRLNDLTRAAGMQTGLIHSALEIARRPDLAVVIRNDATTRSDAVMANSLA